MAFANSFERTLLNISMSDIIAHPWYDKFKDTPNGLNALLYSLGLDIKQPFDMKLCEHRSEITGKVSTCERFSGVERQDEVWLTIKSRAREA